MVIPEYSVIHGDCMTEMRQMDDVSFDAVITDPPYGIDYQGRWRKDSDMLPKIANDKRPFIWWLYDAYRVTREGGALVCFCRWDVQDVFKQAIEWAGYTVRSQVIWDRGNHGLGDLAAQFAPQHDVVWFATKGQGFAFHGGRPQSVIRAMRIGGSALVHPNEKPVDLLRYFVRHVTRPGDTILDPFAGSGSCGKAALTEARSWVGIELDRKYVDHMETELPVCRGQARLFDQADALHVQAGF